MLQPCKYSKYFLACGGLIINDLGVVMSPNYPNPYPVSTTCEWEIVTNIGSNISLAFEDPFEIINTNQNCEDDGDYLLVRQYNYAFSHIYLIL